MNEQENLSITSLVPQCPQQSDLSWVKPRSRNSLGCRNVTQHLLPPRVHSRGSCITTKGQIAKRDPRNSTPKTDYSKKITSFKLSVKQETMGASLEGCMYVSKVYWISSKGSQWTIKEKHYVLNACILSLIRHNLFWKLALNVDLHISSCPW